MFKRANKITALLVAAASVMSLVPAMAADTTRLGTKEGTIQNAVAFSDGKYVYEGYRTDSEDDSVYYNAGDKDKELTDLTDADLKGSYDTKYAFANDGSDQYLVDLSNGSVIDDEAVEDKADTAATKLKTALNKTDRYGDVTVTSANLGYVDEDATGVLSGAKFGDVWYQYGVTTTSSDATDNLVGTKLYGYTNATGKYIDASNLANVYAYSSEKDKVVKIEEFSNKANDEDTDTKLQAELLSAPEYLAQDKDYIYQKVNVKITDTAATGTTADSKATGTVNWPSASSAAFNDTAIVYTVDFTGISYDPAFAAGPVVVGGQSFTFNNTTALAAGEYKDLATLKTAVNNWFAVAANVPAGLKYTTGGKFTATTAGTAGVPASGTYDETADTFTDITTPAANAGISIAGKAFVYKASPTSATEYKDLATLKAAVNTWFAANLVSGFQYNAGVFTAITSQELTTATTPTLAATTAVLKDSENVEFVNGTDGGTSTAGATRTTSYIQKIAKAQGENKDDALLPKTVASYELSSDLYDSDDADDAVTADDASTSYQVTNGTLFAIKNTGSNVKVTTMDLKKDKVKFNADAKPTAHSDIEDKVDVYLVEKGDDDDTDVEATGAVSVDVDGNIWAINEGKIYKFESGEFKTQFTTDSSMDQLDVYDAKSMIAWEDSGDVYTTVNEGTSVTQSESTAVAPVIVTGWVQDGANWSFNDATGTKVTNKWVNVGGAWYFLKADGVMATNWYNDNGTWYFLKSSGAMATGWVNDNGTWYYCNASGAMLANTTVDGYVLGASGAWIK